MHVPRVRAETTWHWQCEHFVGDDEVTSASMRGDRRRADEWRHAWGVPALRTSLRQDSPLLPELQRSLLPSPQSSPPQQQQGPGQRAGCRAAFPPRFGPEFNTRSGEWAAFWDAVGVVPAEVPNLQTRLSYLFGLASAWGFLKVRWPMRTRTPLSCLSLTWAGVRACPKVCWCAFEMIDFRVGNPADVHA